MNWTKTETINPDDYTTRFVSALRIQGPQKELEKAESFIDDQGLEICDTSTGVDFIEFVFDEHYSNEYLLEYILPELLGALKESTVSEYFTVKTHDKLVRTYSRGSEALPPQGPKP